MVFEVDNNKNCVNDICSTYLVPFLFKHTVVRIIGNSKNMRWKNRADPLILIESNIFWIVYGIELEWIEGNQDASHIGVNVAGNEPLP